MNDTIAELLRQRDRLLDLAESNGKLAHDAAINAQRYREQRDTLAKALIHLRDKDWFREGMKGKRVICGMDTDNVRAALAYLEGGES